MNIRAISSLDNQMVMAVRYKHTPQMRLMRERESEQDHDGEYVHERRRGST